MYGALNIQSVDVIADVIIVVESWSDLLTDIDAVSWEMNDDSVMEDVE